VGLCESHARICFLLAGREPPEDTSTHPTRDPVVERENAGSGAGSKGRRRTPSQVGRSAAKL
jgi:hypothetical protein